MVSNENVKIALHSKGNCVEIELCWMNVYYMGRKQTVEPRVICKSFALQEVVWDWQKSCVHIAATFHSLKEYKDIRYTAIVLVHNNWSGVYLFSYLGCHCKMNYKQIHFNEWSKSTRPKIQKSSIWYLGQTTHLFS